VLHQAVQDGGGDARIAADQAPFAVVPVASEHDLAPPIAGADQLQQDGGALLIQRQVARPIGDEQLGSQVEARAERTAEAQLRVLVGYQDEARYGCFTVRRHGVQFTSVRGDEQSEVGEREELPLAAGDYRVGVLRLRQEQAELLIDGWRGRVCTASVAGLLKGRVSWESIGEGVTLGLTPGREPLLQPTGDAITPFGDGFTRAPDEGNLWGRLFGAWSLRGCVRSRFHPGARRCSMR